MSMWWGQPILIKLSPWGKTNFPLQTSDNSLPKDDTYYIKIKVWRNLKIEEGSLISSTYQIRDYGKIDHKIHSRLWNFSIGQNFGGCCSCYITWRHTSWILASLSWIVQRRALVPQGLLIHHVMPINTSSPIIPWIHMVCLVQTQLIITQDSARSQCFELGRVV